MTRRRLLVLVSFSAPLLGVAVACTFPSVDYAPATAPDTGTPDVRANADTGTDANDEQSDATVGTPEASTVDGATCNNSCDCDGDRYWRATDGGCNVDASDAAARLGFGDCDDFNADYHPNQAKYFTEAGGPKGFDFNCSNTVDLLLPQAASCSGSLGACTPSGEFYQTGGECGETAQLSTCVGGGLLGTACTAKTEDVMRTQGCH